MSLIHPNFSLSLLTDLYQLTMAYGYWQEGRAEEQAVFHWFYRKNPFSGDWLLTAGLASVIRYLQDWRFTVDDVQYLGALRGADNRPLFSEGFLNYLQRLRFSCDIDAVEEGRLVFPHQPLLRIKGPLIQTQLLETIFLNLLNFQSLIATKAARVVDAARGDEVLEFGLRRAQGLDGGLSASRSAYIGGCHATSNVLAGKSYGIPVRGTHAHSWVMSYETEGQAFEAYGRSLPNNVVLLIDTYDTLQGLEKAIELGQKLRRQGSELLGVRLDSGDLAQLSRQVRQRLDQAGFEQTKIIASDGLDEYAIAKLKDQGAKIDVWGVGTNLVTAYDQPALGGVYKLGALQNPQGEWTYRIKLSENPIKISNPGILQVRRFQQTDGLPFGDLILDQSETQNDVRHIACFDGRQTWIETRSYEDLLKPIFRQGQLVYEQPPLTDIRQKAAEEIRRFHKVNFDLYPQGLSPLVQERKQMLISKILQDNNT